VADRSTLLRDLDASRQAFLDALSDVDLGLATVPGVIEDWSVRDLVYHVAVWCEHGSEAIDLASHGRAGSFAYSTGDTDAMNARFLDEGRSVSATDALAREEAAFEGFRARIGGLDEALLTLELGNGDTVEAVIVYDGPEHYDEHTSHLRAWFGTDADGGLTDEDS
jgi:Mycothiol maleylpyruvate isomerase N-terminal domain